jgi:hypothetical protein
MRNLVPAFRLSPEGQFAEESVAGNTWEKYQVWRYNRPCDSRLAVPQCLVICKYYLSTYERVHVPDISKTIKACLRTYMLFVLVVG